jgi:hypothetical protein
MSLYVASIQEKTQPQQTTPVDHKMMQTNEEEETQPQQTTPVDHKMMQTNEEEETVV